MGEVWPMGLSAPISLLIDRNYTITVGLMVDVEIVDGGEVQFNSLVLHVFLECRHEIDFFFCFFGRGWKWVVW